MTSIINLTPHAITIRTATGDWTIPPEAVPARVSQTAEVRGTLTPLAGNPRPVEWPEGSPASITGGAWVITDADYPVPIVRYTYGEVTGLPDPDFSRVYIVSAMVTAACPERRDLFSPAEMVRDSDGRIIACAALTQAAS